MTNIVYTKEFDVRGKTKRLNVVNDDFANIPDGCDVFVCSAFKNDYLPTYRSVIGKLYRLGIDVKALSAEPEMDLKNFGVWISQKTSNDKFKRICCVELLSATDKFDIDNHAVDIILKKTFSTLKYAIEQASIAGMDTKRIILPILGAGAQEIELCYIIPPLINQTLSILNLDDVDEITFFEVDKSKASLLTKYLRETLENRIESDVFISYSSKQTEVARELEHALNSRNINCWMAPESIPPSSDYLEIIPNALANTKILLLLLSPDAESSKWVAKEVATAIGANKSVIPYQLFAYDISAKFKFLLDGCQIFAGYEKENSLNGLIEIINKLK